MLATVLLQIVFWASAGLVAFSYAGYPTIIWLASRRRRHAREGSLPAALGSRLPFVTVLIAAHNEQTNIESRLDNALAVDYPADRLEIIVTSDGSTDGTCDMVRQYASRGVRLVHHPRRQGKLAALLRGLQISRGEVVVLSDAGSVFDRQAVQNLSRWFEEPQVGVVCGRLQLVSPRSGRNLDGVYWRYETFIKTCEARLDALVGATGAIYAIRKELFVPPTTDLAVDDFVIPLLAYLRHGCRVCFDPAAFAQQKVPENLLAEFRRRVRIGAGAFHSVQLVGALLHPRHGWRAVSFFSHKLLRWLGPFFLVLMIMANLGLLAFPLYQVTGALQCVFYALAVSGLALRGRGLSRRLIRMTTMFSIMNLALLVGFWRWALGLHRPTWEPTVR